MSQLYNLVKEAQAYEVKQILLSRSNLIEEDLERAWHFLFSNDTSISKYELVEALVPMKPHINISDVNKLVGPGNLTKNKLEHLILDNKHPTSVSLADEKAYEILDPHNKGGVSIDTILHLLKRYHPQENFDAEDLDVISYVLGLTRGQTTFNKENYEELARFKPLLEELTGTQKKLLAAPRHKKKS